MDDTDMNIQLQIDEIKQKSLQSTHRSLHKIYETEDVSIATANQLHIQTSQLNNISKNLEISKQHVEISEVKSKYLEKLKNKWFFIPDFGGRKVKKLTAEHSSTAAELSRDLKQFNENRAKQNETKYGPPTCEITLSIANQTSSILPSTSTSSVDEVIDKNLRDMSKGLSRLKEMAKGMETEITNQNKTIDKLSENTDIVDVKVKRVNKRINTILK